MSIPYAKSLDSVDVMSLLQRCIMEDIRVGMILTRVSCANDLMNVNGNRRELPCSNNGDWRRIPILPKS